VATIPRAFLPHSTNLLDGDERNLTQDMFPSRLQFIARYAEFHDMFARGERKAAARFLVVMLNAKIVPKWWWGVILLDAGGLLDGTVYNAIPQPRAANRISI
jgi:nuclear pore complex protein Nup85